MGKGDKRTRRGKIFAGSYGKTRRKPSRPRFVPIEKPAVSADAAPKERKPKIKKKEAPAPDVVQEQPAETTSAVAEAPNGDEAVADAGPEEAAAVAE